LAGDRRDGEPLKSWIKMIFPRVTHSSTERIETSWMEAP
jgi:hypothetical protein